MDIGDVVIVVPDNDEPRILKEGIVTKYKVSDGFVFLWLDGRHHQEDAYYASFCWPIAAKDELLLILKERKRLKEAYNNSMKLVYDLRNKHRV